MAREYDNIADAISAVNGEVAEQSGKIADILEALEGKGGGTEIADGIVFTELNANGEPLSADFYGEYIGEYEFGASVGTSYHYNLDTLRNFVSKNVKTIANNGFYDTKLTSISIPISCTSIGTNAFRRNDGAGDSIDLTISGGISSFGNYIFYQNLRLRNLQIGSIGNPILSIPNNSFGGVTQASLTVTVYTDGVHADTVLANIRNGATNATIIIKASEDTTYNGVAYSAGDTMITSEVA